MGCIQRHIICILHAKPLSKRYPDETNQATFCWGVLEPLFDRPIIIRWDPCCLLHLISCISATHGSRVCIRLILPHSRKIGRYRYPQCTTHQPPPQPQPQPRISGNCGVGLLGRGQSHQICSDTLPLPHAGDGIDGGGLVVGSQTVPPKSRQG